MFHTYVHRNSWEDTAYVHQQQPLHMIKGGLIWYTPRCRVSDSPLPLFCRKVCLGVQGRVGREAVEAHRARKGVIGQGPDSQYAQGGGKHHLPTNCSSLVYGDWLQTFYLVNCFVPCIIFSCDLYLLCMRICAHACTTDSCLP